MSAVVFSGVTKSFGSTLVIPNLDLTVESGSFTVLVGPSGCGKSTVLRMIAGLEDVSSGRISIDGEDVTDLEPSSRGIAMVFQSYALYPHMTVAENIGFGLKLGKLPKTEIEQRVLEAATTLQLENLLERRPRELSGGQRQRVAIGRAIVRQPKVFLFDEPLSNLDAALRTQMRVELAELHARLDATMVYVTHDQVEAMTMADQIVVLNEGRSEQSGPPMDLYNEPATPFVAEFLGSPKMNLIRGSVASQMGCDLYGIRPEHLELSIEKGLWKGRLRHAEHLGSDTLVYVEAEGPGPLTVRLNGQRRFSTGQEVWLTPQKGQDHRFQNGQRLSE